MSSVAFVYPYIPHYRIPVFKELSNTFGQNGVQIYAGSNTLDSSIKTSQHAEIPITRVKNLTIKGITFQSGLFGVCIGKQHSSIVFLGDPHFATTWVYSLIARLCGKRVLFWTHGWLSPEKTARSAVKNLFYRIPNGLLLYGERAKSIGVSHGFSANSLHVIYNSLDYTKQKKVREDLTDEIAISEMHSIDLIKNKRVFFSCVARLTAACQFNIAIEALHQLKINHGLDVPFVLIGSGPEEDGLRDLANRLNVEVIFLGELYSEEIIGSIVFNSRAVVSPGKVGLTAMHSLAYGTPVITHGEFSTQMPEFEAITPGLTGDFFEKNNPADLATILLRWHNKPKTQDERNSCIQIIEEKYNPAIQARLIREAVQTL